MVYANFMSGHSESFENMVNLNNSDRCELFSEAAFESSEQKYLSAFPHCLSRRIKMDLNEQLLLSLSEPVTSDKVKDIRELLKKRANPNANDRCGNRPIHLAIRNSPDNVDLVLELISFGANVEVVNSRGSTPLTFALEKKCHQTIKILIQNGINLSFQCHRGWTYLMIASMIGDLWSVRTLLERGVNVNTFDGRNRTALMFAVKGKYIKVIKELLAYGANPALRDDCNQTALGEYLERAYPDLDIVNELLLHCASFEGLGKDKNDSFAKMMKICARGGPPYHACVRNVIKIQMLLTRDHRLNSVFEGWYDFASNCCSEIRYMQRYFVSRCGSFTTLLSSSLDGCMPKESELEGLLASLANCDLPNYYDILKAQLRKPFIKKKFLSSLMYVKKEDKDEIIILHSDINVKLMSYLSDDDINNFVLAAYVKKNLPEKISYSSLYPEGKSYSWKDLTMT